MFAMDAELLANSVLAVAEMLGRLAVGEPENYPRERLQDYIRSVVTLLASTTDDRVGREHLSLPSFVRSLDANSDPVEHGIETEGEVGVDSAAGSGSKAGDVAGQIRGVLGGSDTICRSGRSPLNANRAPRPRRRSRHPIDMRDRPSGPPPLPYR